MATLTRRSFKEKVWNSWSLQIEYMWRKYETRGCWWESVWYWRCWEIVMIGIFISLCPVFLACSFARPLQRNNEISLCFSNKKIFRCLLFGKRSDKFKETCKSQQCTAYWYLNSQHSMERCTKLDELRYPTVNSNKQTNPSINLNRQKTTELQL